MISCERSALLQNEICKGSHRSAEKKATIMICAVRMIRVYPSWSLARYGTGTLSPSRDGTNTNISRGWLPAHKAIRLLCDERDNENTFGYLLKNGVSIVNNSS